MQIKKILSYIEENTNSAFFYTPNFYKNSKSYLFKKPYKILKAKTKSEVDELLSAMDEFSIKDNFIGFTIIPYEIGYFFQPKKINNQKMNYPEMELYIFEKNEVQIFDSDIIRFDNIEKEINSNNEIKNFKLNISKNEYVEKIKTIKKYIQQGETYQINYTAKANFNFYGNISSLFLKGIFNQSAKYSAIINSENNFILSFSPELFFETDYKSIISKPMKGTVKRKFNSIEDSALRNKILLDEKNISENVMITDLLRNDIGRIASLNSVNIDNLYEIEKYETLFQLTSTVKGNLKQKNLSEIIKNLFPSGSITGAPKIRSMQIISELEKSQRDIYTGSIGIFDNQKAVFNILIRTIKIDKFIKKGELGLGSGIVWDSDPEKEYEEILLKGKFITDQKKYFELLESILWEKGNYFLLNLHIKRMQESADYFLFKFDEKKLMEHLEKIQEQFEETEKYKVRVLLSKWGSIKIEFSSIVKSQNQLKVLIKKVKNRNENKFYFHKTSFRPWDIELKDAKNNGFDEVLYINENDQLLECASSNILLKIDGKNYTPPIHLGILNGCYRENLIQSKLLKERELNINELKNAEKVTLCNSVRKEMEVFQIQYKNEIIYKNKKHK